MRLTLPLVLAICACSSFREGYREMGNEEWEGKEAPPIEGGTWLGVKGITRQEFEQADYRVLAFFLPQ